MVVTAYAGRLLGRQRERAVLERLLDTARGGHGAVLVVHGDPGVGKTALLEYAVEAGEGFRVLRTAGVEGEMELDYAALQQLCSPILEFLVGLAVLGLLSEAAEPQPLLCVVDDGQWLDGASARALAFVARRLLAKRIALAFATRDVGSGMARFPQLRVEPLGRRDGRESARAPRASARADAGPACRWFRPACGAASVHWDRAELHAAAGPAAARHAAIATPGSGGTGRRPRAPVACRAAGRDPGDGRARGGVGSLADAGRFGGVSASACALGGVRGCRTERAARSSQRAGGRNRSPDRPGSARVAPCAGGVRARRRASRRARALRGASAGTRRLRCSCRFPRTRGRTDTRPRTPCAARARRGSDEIPGGRTRRRARSALVNGGRRARRA